MGLFDAPNRPLTTIDLPADPPRPARASYHPPLDAPPVTTVSFSRILDFEACPYRVYLANVARSPKPPASGDSPLERGIEIHKQAERYLIGELDEVPAPLLKLQAFYEELRSWNHVPGVEFLVEQQWGFTQEWEPCGFFDDEVYARVVLDVCIVDDDVATVVDHKTGKLKGKEVKYIQQLEFYAIATMMRFPQVNRVNAKLGLVDEGRTWERSYHRAQLPALLEGFIRRMAAVTTATYFPARPSRMVCKWCDFGIDVGTQACQYAAGPGLAPEKAKRR